MGLYFLCRENKGADQLHGTAKLICVFVFAYVKSRFSYDATHIIRSASLENLSSEFQTSANTNRAVQPQMMARGLKFWI